MHYMHVCVICIYLCAQMSNDEMESVAQRMMDATFDFNDYLKQANMVKGMGSIAGVAKMIPGMAGALATRFS